MRPAASIGQTLEEVDTPALILDLDAFEKNLATLNKSLRGKDVRVRPHAKTHKCPEIAKRQLAAGAVRNVAKQHRFREGAAVVEVAGRRRPGLAGVDPLGVMAERTGNEGGGPGEVAEVLLG